MILCVLLFKDKQVIHYILGLGMNEKIIIAMFEGDETIPRVTDIPCIPTVVNEFT